MLTAVSNATALAAGQMASPLTMSSREIADLVESRHDDVKRSIKRLADRQVIVQPPLADEHGTDAMGRARATQVYQLQKRDSFVVVAQLSPEFTARLVDRWQQLEQEKESGGFAIPRTLGEALQLAADQAREMENMRNDVAALGRLPVIDMAAKDALLLMWVTVPFAHTADQVVCSWGFRSKSQLVWTKQRIGTGYRPHGMVPS